MCRLAGNFVIPFSDDPRDPSWGAPEWPAWVTSFRPWQVDAVNAICSHYDDGADVVLLNAPTGCLAGDVRIGCHRAGRGFSMAMDEVVARFNGAGFFTKSGSRHPKPAWRSDIPTMVQTSDGLSMRLGQLGAAFVSGLKETFVLTTEGGRTIRATADHRFSTLDGWARLGELSVGDKVEVLLGQGGQNKGIKAQYRIVNFLHHHPFAGRKNVNPTKGGFSVPYHRLVAEARLNDLSTEQFVAQVKAGVTSLTFLDPTEWHVHHRDGDSSNNSLDNLAVLSPVEHQRVHAEEGRWRQVSFHVGLDVVSSIERHGLEPTYDLSMLAPPHNFIANEFVVHNSGKSIIAEAVRRLTLGHDEHCLYVATTKGLQDQMMDNFGSYAKCLKGRSNYPTFDDPDAFNVDPKSRFRTRVTAADCTKHKTHLPACDKCDPEHESEEDQPELHCTLCHSWWRCPYEQAKGAALNAGLAITNTAYFLTEANGPGRFSERDLVVVDECDTLEGILMGQYEVFISRGQQKKYNIAPPKLKTKPESWVEWMAEEAIPRMRMAVAECKARGHSVEAIKATNAATRLFNQLNALHAQLLNGNALYDDYEDGDIRFKIVRVDEIAPGHVWEHAHRWLLMSATIIDPREYVESLGVEKAGLRWELVNVPSTFPVENRPIHVKPAADMTWRLREEEWPKAADSIRKILERHPTERVLIHTVSYALARYLKERMPKDRPVMLYESADKREEILTKYRKTEGAVLLAPSMERGVDLPLDQCRVIIVAKMPFLNIRDKVVAKRMHQRDGSLWYAVQVIRSLVQMTGRGVRSADDACNAYIIDRQFVSNIFAKHKNLLPSWWRDSLNFTGDPDNVRLGGR